MSDKSSQSVSDKIKKVREYAENNKELIEAEQDEAKVNPDSEPSGKMSWPQNDLNKRRELDD